MGRTAPLPPYCPEDPGPIEPAWVGVLKIAGVIFGIGAAIGAIFWGVSALNNRMEKRQEQTQARAAAKGLVCVEEFVYDQRGGWSFCKVTFEGHVYATSANRAFYHLESCPCKLKAEK